MKLPLGEKCQIESPGKRNISKDSTSSGNFFAHPGHLVISVLLSPKGNMWFLYPSYLWSAEQISLLNIFCHSAPNSMLNCPEVPQTLLTFLSGTSCCHLLCWPFLTLLFLCKLLVHLCLRTPVELIAHYSAKHSGETRDRGEVACNQFLFSKPQIKNRNASPDKRY